MKKNLIFLFILLLTILSLALIQFELVSGWNKMPPLDNNRFFIIGTGPAGPSMATMQALDTIKQMDAIIASGEHASLFSDYVGNKPVLFDPWNGLYDYKGKLFHQLGKEEIDKFIQERDRLIQERVKVIKDFLTEGKSVGLLDNGNPLLFGPCNWYLEHFNAQELVIIPGMGSDAAAMAALGKSVLPAHDARFVLQSSPFYLMGHQTRGTGILKQLSESNSTIILYMALQMPQRLFSILSEFYPPDMPCAVVYWAGYPERQRVVKGAIGDIATKITKDEEKRMGLLFIGNFLEGKPYTSAMNVGKNR